MFINCSRLLVNNPSQLNYGVAVTDLDGDGHFEIVVAGFGFPNLALKWDGTVFHDIADVQLADAARQAVGVAAADIDGDGQEELYILNTDTFAGRKRFGDRLLDRVDDTWTDLFSLPDHTAILNMIAGRSVVAVDRLGTGRYGFYVANYGAPARFYELDEDGHLHDIATEVGLAFKAGGRSAVALPLISGQMDIFAGNEGGPNYLFHNQDGVYDEIASHVGLDDPRYHARGIAILDHAESGDFALVCGNWEGPHRLYVRNPAGQFQDIAPLDMALQSRVRTVIAADFDNDGREEIFFNNIGQANRLFAYREGEWVQIDIGDALEPKGMGTGAAVGDFNEDGRLELLIAHGEAEGQPLSLFQTAPNSNHWLRVLPLTIHGAPARGAIVTITAGGRTQRRAIDAGSGYLCQMEPVAHFGLGAIAVVDQIHVRWLDGAEQWLPLPKVDSLVRIEYPEVALHF